MIITGKDLLETENLLDTITDGLGYIEQQDYNGRIHASTSGYCPRRGALEASYKGEKTVTPQSALYFKMGIGLEESILSALDKNKRLFFLQYSLPDTGLNLGGRVDGVILHNGKIHVLEIKTCGALPANPIKEHVSQLNIYSAVTGLPGLLLYVSRHVQKPNGELKMKLFEMGFNPDENSQSLKNSAVAFFASKNGLLPEIPEYIQSADDCGFCPFKNICWEHEFVETLEYMSDSESEMIKNAADEFIKNFMSSSEIRKRRNGVLKYLSVNGNKTARFYLDNEDWEGFLLEL